MMTRCFLQRAAMAGQRMLGRPEIGLLRRGGRQEPEPEPEGCFGRLAVGGGGGNVGGRKRRLLAAAVCRGAAEPVPGGFGPGGVGAEAGGCRCRALCRQVRGCEGGGRVGGGAGGGVGMISCDGAAASFRRDWQESCKFEIVHY